MLLQIIYTTNFILLYRQILYHYILQHSQYSYIQQILYYYILQFSAFLHSYIITFYNIRKEFCGIFELVKLFDNQSRSFLSRKQDLRKAIRK